MTPKRIQRKRTKGWRMPEGAVYVGRPTKWGNPFWHAQRFCGVEISLKMYRQAVGSFWDPAEFADVTKMENLFSGVRSHENAA